MEALASQGLRVLAFAHRLHDSRFTEGGFMGSNTPHREHIERDLTIVGLLGIYDPPRPESMNLKYGVFTPEFLCDMLFYGLAEAGCILGPFTLVIWGFANGDLGTDCNVAYSDSCTPMFRARATAYAATTWIFVFFAWKLIDLRRSFFYMPDDLRG
ncbi:hypothetical protein Z517_00946 [Fonsecaea pedrosoi CBS 271.37]|uniref:Uncharacterized protein n=1 Tax=Fonsecaea pedrosoi CBS 271.37 TaxID=1442368 RepID=A0A0D2HM86_9EURO|nr:uncharacterized protein Z517_00946 [Fonsecaea pedrosoi CBS 271.37]KIW85554.1 hypothetical protein Z517_00946 [Fonsecaea pedrosoi CBS 271.37]